jgi:hypothetical protein
MQPRVDPPSSTTECTVLKNPTAILSKQERVLSIVAARTFQPIVVDHQGAKLQPDRVSDWAESKELEDPGSAPLALSSGKKGTLSPTPIFVADTTPPALASSVGALERALSTLQASINSVGNPSQLGHAPPASSESELPPVPTSPRHNVHRTTLSVSRAISGGPTHSRHLASPSKMSVFEFPQERSLPQLVLSNSNISDQQLGSLAAQYGDSLHSVELIVCEEVTDAGIRALAGIKHLHTFSLNSCKCVTAAGVVALLTSNTCRRLRSLCLVSIELTQPLLDALFKLAEIDHLELSCCAGISDEQFLVLGNLPRLQKFIATECGISQEAMQTFQEQFPQVVLASLFAASPQPTLEVASSGLPLQTTAVVGPARVKPLYQFLIDFLALNYPDVSLETVLQEPEVWKDLVNAYYSEEFRKRHLECTLPMIPENWHAFDCALQEYRPVEYVFLEHFADRTYGVSATVVCSELPTYENGATQFYETALKEKEIQYDFPITPDTWLFAEQLLQAHEKQIVLNVFVKIFRKQGYFEVQLAEQAPVTLEDLYRIVLANIKMLEGITVLDFNNLQLTDFSHLIFRTRFKFLRKILLENNRMRIVPDFFLAGSKHLETVYLGHNQLRAVPDHFGEDYEEIVTLDFQNNAITEIPVLSVDQKGTKAFQKLRLLNFEYNQISEISEAALAGLSQLPLTTMVDLTGNPLCDFPDRLKQYRRRCPQIMVRLTLPSRSAQAARS